MFSKNSYPNKIGTEVYITRYTSMCVIYKATNCVTLVTDSFPIKSKYSGNKKRKKRNVNLKVKNKFDDIRHSWVTDLNLQLQVFSNKFYLMFGKVCGDN